MKKLISRLALAAVFLTTVFLMQIPESDAYSTYDNFRVLKNTAEELTIVGYDSDAAKKQTEIVIPEEISGTKVVAIDFKEDDPDVTGFSECTKLEKITIPKTVTSIKSGCFSNTALQEIIVDADNPSYASHGGALYNKDLTKLIQYPIDSPNSTYVMPVNVVIIDSYAFAGATNLTTITLPVNLERIEDHAFYNCGKLAAVDGSSSVKLEYIGESAFENDNKLSKITLPAAVETLDNRVFANCTSLGELILPAKLETLGKHAFLGCTALYGEIIETTMAPTAAPTTVPSAPAVPATSPATSPVTTPTPEPVKVITTKKLTIPEGTLTIGEGAFYGCSKGLTEVSMPTTVTEIPKNAFYGCSVLDTIDLKDTLKLIDDSAFQNCVKLKEFTMGADGVRIGKNAFDGCKELVKATLYEGVQTIDEYAFYNCTKLESIIIPWSVNDIGKSAFEGCTNLASADIPTAVEVIGERTFYGCKNLVNLIFLKNSESEISVQTIGESAFENCVALTAIEIPPSLREISNRTFYGCKELENLDIPGNVGTIGESAFEGCIKITDLTIKSGVKNIKKNAFSGCKGITSIIFEEGLETIGETAFLGSTQKKTAFELVIPSTVTSIEKNAFEGAVGITSVKFTNSDDGRDTIKVIEENVFLDCKNLQSVKLPDSVTEIKKYAFSGCSALNNIVFVQEREDDTTAESKLKIIGEGAFYGSSDKKAPFTAQVVIPESVEEIGNKAFADMKGLDTVIINANIERLPSNIFNGSALRSVTMPETLKVISSKAFENCANLSEVNFNDGLETIESEAFVGSTSAKVSLNLVIPANVQTIGASAFEGMDGLKSVVINADITELADNMFASSAVETVVLPLNLEIVGESAFEGCGSLKSINFPSTLKTIKTTAFSQSGLTAVTIPDSVTTVGESAFEKCESLLSARLSSGMVSIAPSLFADCKAMTDLVIQEGTVIVGESAFKGCSTLTALTIPDGVVEIGESAFSDCSGIVSIEFPESLRTIGESAFLKCVGLLELELPDGLKTIGEKAFSNCTGILKVTIPSSVEDIVTENEKGKVITVYGIGKNSFQKCTGIIEIVFKDGITSLGGEGAFSSCESLETVTIPASVTNIANKFFDKCTALKKATFGGDAPATFGEDVFADPKKALDRGFTVCYCEGSKGFTTPWWHDYSCTEIVIEKFDIIPPDKTVYQEGEEFDPTGMKVSITFDTGITQEITTYTLSGYSSTPGIKTMTVTYLGKTGTFEVTVINPLVTGIELTPPTKITYLQSDKEIDISGMSVTAFYSNGMSRQLLSSEYRLKGFEPGTAGKQTITVTHMGFEKTFEILVISEANGSLDAIKVVGYPKLDYIEGQEFDKSGLIVNAIYNEGEINQITETIDVYELTFDVSDPMNSVGSHIVTITYGGKKDMFVITVTKKELLSLKIEPPTKTTYLLGEPFEKDGMVVYANYSNGKSEEVTGFDILGYDANKATKQAVQVIYNGVVATFDVVVTVDDSSSMVCDMELVGIPSRNDTKLTFVLDINNKRQENRDATIIVATYKSANSELVGRVRTMRLEGDKALKNGSNKISVETYVGLDVGMENCYFKIFLWDGLHTEEDDLIAPMAKMVEYKYSL